MAILVEIDTYSQTIVSLYSGMLFALRLFRDALLLRRNRSFHLHTRLRGWKSIDCTNPLLQIVDGEYLGRVVEIVGREGWDQFGVRNLFSLCVGSLDTI